MKSFLVFIITIFNFNAVAMESPVSDDCPSCHRSLSGMPMNGSLSDVEKIANARDPKLTKLSNTICKRIEDAKYVTNESIEDVFETAILEYLSISKSDKNYRKKITDFWSKNQHQMICDWKIQGLKSPQLVSRRIIDMHLHREVYFNYLLQDKSIDLNAISHIDGKKETILDYINSILNSPTSDQDYDVKSIKRLKKLFIKRYGAKTARELQV